LSKSKKSYKLSVRYKEQSQRQLKVSRAMWDSLVECFRREGKLDYRLEGCPVSITEVNISADLRVANCFFVPFNTDFKVSELLDALEKSKYVIRNYITRRINLRYSPEIRFYYDQNSENFEKIENLT
jgi:ribosome-binding factor A